MGRRHPERDAEARENSRAAHLGNHARGPALTIYLDTSALLKLYVEERGATVVRAQTVSPTRVATSLVSYVEARAAFARRRRAGDLTPAEHRRVVTALAEDWDRFVRIDVTEPLVREAAQLADVHRLRAYDALQLASALWLRGRLPEAPTFASWDDALDAAAAREGLPVLRGR